MFHEFDDFYRYPLQEALGEINIQALRKNRTKELLRILEIMRNRSVRIGQKEKWGTIKMAVWLVSKMFRKEMEELEDLICLLDLSKIRLDIHDQYHCLIRSNYNFGGISFEKRYAERKQIDEEWQKELLKKK